MKRLILTAIVVSLFAGCDFLSNEEVEGHEVVYYVTSSSQASNVAIEYREAGNQMQDTLIGLLWTRSFLAESASLQLSAKNVAADTSLVRTLILVDDEVVAADSVTSDSLAASVQYDL